MPQEEARIKHAEDERKRVEENMFLAQRTAQARYEEERLEEERSRLDREKRGMDEWRNVYVSQNFFSNFTRSVLSRNPDFKFGGGQFVFFCPNFFFSTTREHSELYIFFLRSKKKQKNGAAGEKFFGYGINV